MWYIQVLRYIINILYSIYLKFLQRKRIMVQGYLLRMMFFEQDQTMPPSQWTYELN